MKQKKLLSWCLGSQKELETKNCSLKAKKMILLSTVSR
jgi:hypothetical protein